MCQLLIINDSNLHGAKDKLEFVEICIFAMAAVKVAHEG